MVLEPRAVPGAVGWSWSLIMGAGVEDWELVLLPGPGPDAEGWEVFLESRLVLRPEAGTWSWSR